MNYPLVNVTQSAMFTPTIGTLYCDFYQLTNAIGDIQNGQASVQNGINVWPVRLIRTPSGTTIVQSYSDTALLDLPAAEDENFETRYAGVLRTWCILTGKNPTSYEDLITQGCVSLAPRSIVLDVWLADVHDCPMAALTSMMAGSDTCDSCDDPSPADADREFNAFGPSALPCGRLTFNKFKISTNNFILEWFSESNATYEIVSATDVKSTNWTSLASLYPASTTSNLTSFTDAGGATNKTKFYKVAKTGISITLCQSNTLSGTVTIPFELGMPPSQPCLGIQFVLDGASTRSIWGPTNPISEARATWDTETTSNGWHTLRAIALYTALETGGAHLPAYASQIVTVQTANAIVLPEFPLTFGSRLPINALLAASNADWTVTIRDPAGATLWSTNGSTTAGKVNTAWTGSSPDAWVEVEVTATPTTGLGPIMLGGGSSSSTKKKVHKKIGGFSNGYLVAYEEKINSEVLDGGVVALCASIYDILDTQSDYWQVTASIADNPASWTAFHNMLADPQTANLYVFCHGSPQTIGFDPLNQRGLGRCGIFSSELGVFLMNGPIGDKFLASKPYRFVFLDGCETGGSYLLGGFLDFSPGVWNNAFGIQSGDYTATGSEPQAFMGWKTQKAYAGPPPGRLFDTSHRNFVQGFYTGWANGSTLKQASDDAYNSLHDPFFTKPYIVGVDTLSWQ